MAWFDAAANWGKGGDFWTQPQLALSSSSSANNSAALESSKVYRICICTYHNTQELLKGQTWRLSMKYHVQNCPSIRKSFLAILLNVFEAASSPAEHSESMYWQHKYWTDTIIQAIANVFQDWKCVQHTFTIHNCPFFCFLFWLAFLLIQVIRQSSFYIFPMNKGSIERIVLKTGCPRHIMVTCRHIICHDRGLANGSEQCMFSSTKLLSGY